MSSDSGDPAPPSFGAAPDYQQATPSGPAQPSEPGAPPVVAQRYEPPPPPAASPITPGRPQEPLNPWFSIWVMPRATMRQILDSRPGRLVHFLAILGGVVEVMRAHLPNPPFSIDLGPMIAFKAILGVMAGLFALYLWSILLWMTGRWLGGQGGFVAVRAAVAWSNVPLVWSAMLWLPLLAYLGVEAFNFDPQTILEEPSGLLLMIPLGLMALTAGVWWLVILLKCVGEAHRFSAWHALGASLISCIIFAIPILVLVVAAVSIVGIAGLTALTG